MTRDRAGKAEAKKAYERVIREYADQAESLQVARARLAALVRPPRHEMTVRRVWFHFSSSYPYQQLLRQIVARLVPQSPPPSRLVPT